MWSLGGSVYILVCLSFTNGQSDVRMPPYITKGPRDSAIFRSDDTVTLDCKGEGVPTVNYEWKRNGFDLNQNLPNIKRGVDGTITISPATTLDEGFYQCFVRNQYGVALSLTSHLQKAVLDSVSGAPNVIDTNAEEGKPFKIEAFPRRSFPKPTYGWEVANDAVDKNPLPFNPSNRVQIADNGDLHFAYIKPEDNLGGRIYKCTTYNQYLDIKAGGTYTKVSVTRGTQSAFAPTLGFASEPQTVGIIGESVSLRCFFYGNPEPTIISWKGPGGTLPMNRYKMDKSTTELNIFNITASDQGDYVCSTSNTGGQRSHTLQLRVEAKPKFKNFVDGPRNTNVTDGEDATFKCNAEAIPGAEIAWLQDGKKLDVNLPPKKFSFSSDRKTLTIRSVCRNCDDPDRQTDLTVIQCNASNIHGYAFSSGYLNILAKTQIIPDDEITQTVVENEDKRFDFECSAVSDPSTFPTVRWYRLKDGKEELVYDNPPTITLTPKDGGLTLSIHVPPNGTVKWTDYEAEYHCLASNGYSKATRIAHLKVTQSGITGAASAGIADWWWIFLIIALILILLIIILCCCIYLQRNKGDKYDVDEKERKNGNDPEKELMDGDFKDYKRPEGQTLKGSRGSLGSSVKLNSDEEASLNEYGDDPGKFTEDGSFVGAYTGTADRKKGRNQ